MGNPVCWTFWHSYARSDNIALLHLPQDGGLSGGAIAGIVVGVLVGILLIGVVVILVIRSIYLT